MHIDLCYKESEGTVLKLSESSDLHLAGTATLLGSMQPPAVPGCDHQRLGNLGDQRATELIADMIKKADNRASWERLPRAYI